MLELLCGPEAKLANALTAPELDATLQVTLERVGEGRDTPEKLTRGGGDCGEILLALERARADGAAGTR